MSSIEALYGMPNDTSVTYILYGMPEKETVFDTIYGEPILRATVDQDVSNAKELLGEYCSPYSVRKDVDGNVKVVLDVHFLLMVKQALDKKCVARMSFEELKLWYDYVAYHKDIVDNGTRTTPDADPLREQALVELAQWIDDEKNKVPHPKQIDCFTDN